LKDISGERCPCKEYKKQSFSDSNRSSPCIDRWSEGFIKRKKKRSPDEALWVYSSNRLVERFALRNRIKGLTQRIF
jgi:hypothetical protein